MKEEQSKHRADIYKGKVHPRIGFEGPKREKVYRSTVSLY
jgi:hypothetical protein